MKRKTRRLLDCAKESLILGVEVFNRPSEVGRVEGVLLTTNHAFEMLLKAVVFEKTGRIRAKNDKYNYGFEKCVGVCQTQLNVLDENEALSLKNLNGFRDAAAHDLVEISEGLLYAHIEQAVLIFGALLKRVFNKELARWLPRRILPLSTSLPREITAIVEEDMAAISSMLSKGHRQGDDAEARLRPYEVMEKNIRESQGGEVKEPSAARLVRKVKKGDWRTVLPMVAGLVQPDTSGIPVSLHVTKKNGFPVRIDPNASAAIAFRYVKPEDKYPYLTSELAKKLGTSTSKVVGLVKVLEMRNNEAFHTAIKVSQKGVVNRYSEKARRVMEAAIAKEGMDALWVAAKAGEHRDPSIYPVSGANGETSPSATAGATQ
jgi:hypothetical protein